MHGPTSTMSMTSLFSNRPSFFSRSNSSSNITSLASHVELKRESPPNPNELPRAASYTSIPALENPAFTFEKDRLRAFSIDNAAEVTKSSMLSKEQELNHSTGKEVPQDNRPKLERVGRRQSLVARPKSWIQKAKGSSSPDRVSSPERKTPPTVPPVPPVPLVKKRSLKELKSGSFASFARKSWISTSRSPSPSRQRQTQKENDAGRTSREEEEITPASSVSSSSPRKAFTTPVKQENSNRNSILTSTSLPAVSRKGTLLKRSKRPKSEIITGGDLKAFKSFRSANTSVTSFSNLSAEDLPTPRLSLEIPPLPRKFSTDKLAGLGMDAPRKKDELWTAFRTLESEFAKFQTKTSALRTNVVRSSLLPFLRTHAMHPTNKNLRPEDVDRRVNVLNKWWRGLLEMLDGHNNQYISGIDRPVILEAITAIMIRPEWRLPPSLFAPLSERSLERPVPRARSSGSLSSTASQFLADSVYHNVRNMFIQNLLSQMGMVVDKMSLRTVPASLVTFCGKAAAYAFFFCPGVAEILLKLWAVPADMIRRMADEFGLLRRHMRSDTDEIVAEFPPHLHSLGWRSAKAIVAQMHQRGALPLGAAKISWYGPWIARWCARDSDLFFVFCKHYHILLEEFLPPDAAFSDKARAPGFLLVQCQLLTTLDTTIHRQPSGDAATGPAAINFDDVLTGIDASASALPLPPSSNASRLMAENRLIMLLRDFLSERPSEFGQARRTFAAAFSHVMQASARRTSQFDHNACFIMCDFIEEALPIYLRYQNAQEDDSDYIEWSFWLTVCDKILQSENSLSQIRVFSFIFGAWKLISGNESRKAALCLQWLLSEDNFMKFYLHWCPMVRAYYMRLLCWRICRYDGEASQLDTKVLSMISDRLKLVYANYLHLKQAAERANITLPSIAPCHPAPGRRLLIIRNDTQAAAANLMLGFDGIYPKATPSQAANRRSSIMNMPQVNTNESSDPSRKKWSLLGKIMPFNGNVGTANNLGPTHQGEQPSAQSTSPASKSPLELARATTASTRKSAPQRPSIMKTKQWSSSSISVDSVDPPSPTHRAFSFKFSLEWGHAPQTHQAFHMEGGPDSRRSFSKGDQARGRERRLGPPRLPAPAHSWLVSQVPGTANEIWARAAGKSVEAEIKYAGRALAEWALIVMECNNFVERRRAEGVPNLKLMEIPTLGVEGFKKFS